MLKIVRQMSPRPTSRGPVWIPGQARDDRKNLAWVLLCICWLQVPLLHATSTTITLDGVQTNINFTDGDTFRSSSQTFRVINFNALESYGAVHQWGSWTSKELYQIAQEATKNARLGNWHCHTQHKSDAYERKLVHCPDLALSQIRQGLAQAMFFEKSDNTLLAAQKDAILNQRGMWEKGVVGYLLTSAHESYDRFVSTETGLSKVISHSKNYSLCELISYTPELGVSASTLRYVPFQHRYGNTRAACL